MNRNIENKLRDAQEPDEFADAIDASGLSDSDSDSVSADDGDGAADSEVSLSASTDGVGLDPVRVYLREMGASPLLTRDGEVEIAKRIEHGRRSVRKSLTRSPLIIEDFLAFRADILPWTRVGEQAFMNARRLPFEFKLNA